MPISKARVQDFLERVCLRHGAAPLRVGKAAPKTCRRTMKIMRLGCPIKRDVLAHQLGHWLQGQHLRERGEMGMGMPMHGRGGVKLHGKEFTTWHRYAQNLVAEEFGSTEGVSL